MRALVLGGGSIKGGWQVGAIKAVCCHGYTPEIICGISVGSVNGVYIANEAGKYRSNNEIVDWSKIGYDLEDFWLEKIINPECIAIKRNTISLIWSILRKKFNGITDNEPLRKLIKDTTDFDFLYSSGISLFVGTVNVADGKIYYAKPSFPDFLDYVLASTAIPFMMPVSHLGKRPFLDGGLRDSAPLKIAIDAGATEIICIGCHPKEAGSVEINTGNVVELSDRIMNIVSNNNLNSDIEEATLINQLLDEGNSGKYLNGKKKIKLTIIRPDLPIDVNVSNFNSEDIEKMISSGYETARDILDEQL